MCGSRSVVCASSVWNAVCSAKKDSLYLSSVQPFLRAVRTRNDVIINADQRPNAGWQQLKQVQDQPPARPAA